MEVWPETEKAIEEALTAGACWLAAENSEKHADVWKDLAAKYSRRAATHLVGIVERSGV